MTETTGQAAGSGLTGCGENDRADKNVMDFLWSTGPPMLWPSRIFPGRPDSHPAMLPYNYTEEPIGGTSNVTPAKTSNSKVNEECTQGDATPALLYVQDALLC